MTIILNAYLRLPSINQSINQIKQQTERIASFVEEHTIHHMSDFSLQAYVSLLEC